MSYKRTFDDKYLGVKKETEDNLSKFLPHFLIDQITINPPTESKLYDENDLQFYLNQLSVGGKENNCVRTNHSKLPRIKSYINEEPKQFANVNRQRERTNDEKDNNQMNINYNINQNINQNFRQPSFKSVNNQYFSPQLGFQGYSQDYSNGELVNRFKSQKVLHLRENEDLSYDGTFQTLAETIDSLPEGILLWEHIKTQKGSRNFQKMLNRMDPDELDKLLNKIKLNLSNLMMDKYGNYFCQKLIQSCSHEQRITVLSNIISTFTLIACDSAGTHSIQSLIDIINMPEEEELVKLAVRDNILALSLNINGTHVMQKVLTSIPEENRHFINRTVLENLEVLIYDSNGICVVKKFINSNKNAQIKKTLLGKINKNSLEIVQNAYGNYVIQHILDEWGFADATEIIEMIIGNLISLSMQKFASNVVEKCFDLVDGTLRRRFISELFNPGKVSSLLKNKYGNFVLQKAILQMTELEKKDVRQFLIKRVGLISNREKTRLISLIDLI